MCGIAGIAGSREPELLRSMTEALAHRGPDDEGFFEDGDVALGMRRLSIIDLETGRQPLSGEEGRATVVFNGEIYNHPELRRELEAKGHRFTTRSDTECIVHLYEDYGSGCVEKLRGMFAFAVYDRRDRSIFVARDRLGIKPLYYAHVGRVLYFASELRALMLAPIDRELDPESVRQYVDLLYVGGPHALLRGARKLEPGSWLRWKDGRLESGRYWSPSLRRDENPRATEIERLDALLRGSVREQRAADVPVGLFLSGGLDSSALAVCLADEKADVEAYCLRTGRPEFDEWDKASRVASLLGMKLNAVDVELRPDIDAFVSTVDEPLADSSAIATWWVSRACRGRIKVALTGVGGDELFGGYPRYLGARWLGMYGRLPAGARRALARAAGSLPDIEGSRNPTGWARRFTEGGRLGLAEAYRLWLGHAPAGLFSPGLVSSRPDPILESFGRTEGFDPVRRALAADLENYLPDDLLALADRASMAASLELRVPLLDERLVEFACSLPSELRTDGFSLKRLLKDWLRRRLPAELVDQKKRGFMVPMAGWLRGELRESMLDCLSDSAVRSRGYFRPEAVARIVQEHLSGRRSRPDLLWAMMLLELWQRRRLPQARFAAAAPRLSLLVVSDFHFSDSEGGAGRVALETAKDLAKRGHRVACWGPSGDGTASVERQGGLLLSRAPVGLSLGAPYEWPAYARKARAHLEALALETRPQAVLAHQPRASWLASGVGALEGVPTAYFFHSCWGDEYRLDRGSTLGAEAGAAAREVVERAQLRRAAKIVVLSRFMEGRLALHGVDGGRIRRVPAGVDLERFRPPARPVDSQDLRLLTVRNLRPRMGLENLVSAFAELRPDFPGSSLTIAGIGPLSEALRRQAASLGLADAVRFPGRVPDEDLPGLYASASVFVLPSREHEGLGLVLLEALASGVPAVGTPVGGIPEVLEAIEPRWIADDVTSRALAAAVRRAAPAAADSRRRSECRKFSEGFPWSATGGALEEVLLAIL